jgi:hypothetical protein
VSEDFEKKHPEPEMARNDDDVEAHGLQPAAAAEDKVAATEEGPDVEAHRLAPKHKP